MSWHEGPMVAFDTETTGQDPEQARIVQYAVARLGDGSPTHIEQLVDPGVEIPAKAVEVHGITTELVREQGQPTGEVLGGLVAALGEALAAGVPVVGHNVSYDLTVVDRECRRHLDAGLEETLGRAVAPVVDTLVLSKHVDPYRRRVSKEQGAHELKTCVQALIPPKWGIVWEDDAAHGALYDCLMSARVAVAIGQGHPQVGGMDLVALHAAQVTWRAEQCASLQAYFRDPVKSRESHDPNAVIDGRWPIIPVGGVV